MAVKSYNELVTKINEIQTGAKYTAAKLRPLFQDILDSLKAPYFEFLASPALTPDDIGKALMVNEDGEAVVYQRSPAQSGQVGKWVINIPPRDLAAKISFSTNGIVMMDVPQMAWNFAGAPHGISPATPGQEAVNFVSFLNETGHFSAEMGATGASVIFEALEVTGPASPPPFFTIVWVDADLEVSQEPIQDLPARSDKRVLGKMVGLHAATSTAFVSKCQVDQFPLSGETDINDDNKLRLVGGNNGILMQSNEPLDKTYGYALNSKTDGQVVTAIRSTE